MEVNMPAMTDTQLVMFNTLALQIQDEAYTLAYYLLGDEARAAEATEGAFARLYQRPGLMVNSFRRDVFQRVLAQCRGLHVSLRVRSTLMGSLPARDEVTTYLLRLNESERAVVVLVDVLGLSYDEAAGVLGTSKKQAGKLLAQARLCLSHPAGITQ
jgi:DNA-directed RNA polymerase specialized sigma24 family protein